MKETAPDETGRFHRGFTKLVIPGTLYRHAKTGGWYWKVASRHVPPRLHRGNKMCYLPLVPQKKKFATKARGVAEMVMRQMYRAWLAELGKHPAGMCGLLDQFEQANRLRASAHHAAGNRQMLERFLNGQQVSHPCEIDADRVEGHLAAMQVAGRAAATIVAHKHTIGAFCKFLIRKGELDSNPADMIQVARPAKRPPRYLTDFQAVKFLMTVLLSPHRWLFPAACFGVYAGLRVGEIAALEWKDIGDAITVGGSQPTKTGDYRYVPIRPELAGLIGAMKRGEGRVFPKHHQVYWGKVMAETTRGLPVFGELKGRRVGNQWHLLRSTYAVNRAREGATLWQLMAELGHSDPNTTMRYVNVARAGGVDG